MSIHDTEPHSVHIMPAGRLKRETDAAKTARRMLESLQIWGTHVLRITEKIKGGPEHIGIDIVDHVVYASVCLKIQSGDSGTRFLCYLTSKSLTPASLLDLVRSRAGSHWNVGDEYPPRSLVKTPTVQKGEALSLPPKQPLSEEPVMVGKGKLSAYAQDPILRDMMITAFREKFSDHEFAGRDAHKIIAGLAGQPAPTTNASGQLIRRYCEQGYVVKTKTIGLKNFYRVVREEEKLQKLRAIAAEIGIAKASFDELCREEKECVSQIEEMRHLISEQEKRLAGIVSEKAKQQAVIDDPERKAAQTKLSRILSILGK